MSCRSGRTPGAFMANQHAGNIQKRTQWKRVALLVVLSAANLALLVHIFFGEMGVLRWRKAQAAADLMREETALLNVENDHLRGEIASLRNDPFYIERLARERLGMVREGERVYEFYPGQAAGK